MRSISPLAFGVLVGSITFDIRACLNVLGLSYEEGYLGGLRATDEKNPIEKPREVPRLQKCVDLLWSSYKI